MATDPTAPPPPPRPWGALATAAGYLVGVELVLAGLVDATGWCWLWLVGNGLAMIAACGLLPLVVVLLVGLLNAPPGQWASSRGATVADVVDLLARLRGERR